MSRGRRVLARGVAAAAAAATANAVAAGLARAAGVDFEVASGESIPVGGIAFVTGVLSLVGVPIAAAVARWSRRPATAFVRTTAALTALSLVPPFLAGADAATTTTLVLLHLLAAALVVPALAAALRPDRDLARSLAA
ncbi:DUF6069 family protein [Nocardioides pinisoli]|uniref:DUF6069 family protein n=1 Tax=Nocardioides pinisoli TaxID=2950279 RepID=A0ABT1KRP9_9ACTN|nr:DUF6069 family protein [Nocardioides pinisoli]MCP3420418.1 DUF6069 family protein [Nocardioides pinisoli]